MIDPEVSAALDGVQRQVEGVGKDLAELAPRLASVEAALRQFGEREAQRLVGQVHDKVSALGTALDEHAADLHERFDAMESHVAERARKLHADVAAALETPRALAVALGLAFLLGMGVVTLAERLDWLPDLHPPTAAQAK